MEAKRRPLKIVTDSHEQQVKTILKLKAEGKSQIAIAEITGYRRHRVRLIFNGDLAPPKEPHPREGERRTSTMRRLNRLRHQQAHAMLDDGAVVKAVMAATGMSERAIRHLIERRNRPLEPTLHREARLCKKCETVVYVWPCQVCPARRHLASKGERELGEGHPAELAFDAETIELIKQSGLDKTTRKEFQNANRQPTQRHRQ